MAQINITTTEDEQSRVLEAIKKLTGKTVGLCHRQGGRYEPEQSALCYY